MHSASLTQAVPALLALHAFRTQLPETHSVGVVHEPPKVWVGVVVVPPVGSPLVPPPVVGTVQTLFTQLPETHSPFEEQEPPSAVKVGAGVPPLPLVVPPPVVVVAVQMPLTQLPEEHSAAAVQATPSGIDPGVGAPPVMPVIGPGMGGGVTLSVAGSGQVMGPVMAPRTRITGRRIHSVS
jgi:hypothetical protein